MSPDIVFQGRQVCNRLAERNPAAVLQVQDTIKDHRRASNAPTTHYSGTRPEQEIQANPDQRGAPPQPGRFSRATTKPIMASTQPRPSVKFALWQGSNERDSFSPTERSSPVMLSAAKHLSADRYRPFAALSVTRVILP